jgi:hypothetical protein
MIRALLNQSHTQVNGMLLQQHAVDSNTAAYCAHQLGACLQGYPHEALALRQDLQSICKQL